MASSLASRRWLPYAAAITAGAIVIVVAYSFVRSPYWSHGCGGMFSAMSKTNTGECVGVVDRADILDPEVRDVFDKVQKQNEAVARSVEPYVKIVLLTPLTRSKNSDSAMSLKSIRYSLEGAFTAQYRVNNDRDFGDPSAVKVQMLLANQGSRQEYSDRLVADIMDRDESDHPVVAVVGLGSSFVGTRTTAQALARRGIPMMSAVVSADTLDADDVKGLRSVAPSNTAYAAALAELLDNHPALNLKAGIIVADQNDDLYVQTLRKAFDRLGGYTRFPPQVFTGGGLGANAVPNVFRPVVSNICNAASDPLTPLDMVFYAGRVADFEAFAQSLENRTCRARPLTILVGATGFDAVSSYADLLKRGNITVIYASSSDAGAWAGGGPHVPVGFADFVENFRARGYADGDLANGYAIMYHDAVVSTASVIRLAAEGRTVPRAADVDSQFDNLNLANAVPAASGTLSFGATPDGRAVGKVVVYRQIGLTTPVRLPQDLKPYVTKS